jgi:exodeoxyribonuclease VII small subunit
MSEKQSQPVESLSFEDALTELRTIVERLESGKGSLDDAIAAYERGAQLKAHCEAKLKEAQLKIEKVSMGPGGPRLEDFPSNASRRGGEDS